MRRRAPALFWHLYISLTHHWATRVLANQIATAIRCKNRLERRSILKTDAVGCQGETVQSRMWGSNDTDFAFPVQAHVQLSHRNNASHHTDGVRKAFGSSAKVQTVSAYQCREFQTELRFLVDRLVPRLRQSSGRGRIRILLVGPPQFVGSTVSSLQHRPELSTVRSRTSVHSQQIILARVALSSENVGRRFKAVWVKCRLWALAAFALFPPGAKQRQGVLRLVGMT